MTKMMKLAGTSSSLLLYITLFFSFLESHLSCAGTVSHGIPSISKATLANGKDLAPHRTNLSGDIDLVSFLSAKTHRHDAIFTDAVLLLESMKSSPSCNRIAATKLVTSCQSIGGKGENIETDTNVALDHLRSLYAARLAICELNGAGTATPPSCLPVTITPQHKKGFFGFSNKHNPQLHAEDSIPIDLLEPCLRSLESRPQWWTSYSNNRQNAIVICQASRIENEKEELLELHRFVAENTQKLNNALQEALRTAAEDSAQHKAFIDVVASMRVRLTHELEESETLVRRAIANMLHDIGAGVDSAVTGVTSVFGRARMEATALEKVIRAVSTEVEDLQRILLAVHGDTLTRNEQLMEMHQQDVMTHNELSTSLQSSLESLLQNDIARISQSVIGFDSLLEWLYARMHLILEQETVVSERLRNFETSLSESERKAENLHKEQVLQSEAISAQSRAQETLQANMQISQALLDKATTTVANLQAMVDEAASKYREPQILTGLFGQHSAWTVSTLLLSIIGALSPRAALAVLFIGSIHFFATKIR